MAYIQDDFNASGAKDSVFDWGHSSRDSGRSKSNGSSKNSSSNNDDSSKNSIGSAATSGPTSRYDPSAMSRIVDINDLVDDDDDDDDSDSDDNVIHNGHRSNNISAKNQRRKSKNRQKLKHQYPSSSYKSPLVGRQVVILTVLVGIIAAASVAIGYAVMNSDNPNNNVSGAPPTKLGGGSEGNNNDNVARQQQAGAGQQKLLEIAEMVIEACSEDALDEDMSQCQSLCHANMCCFEEEGYGCGAENDVDCAVYGGCQALLVGVEMEDGEEGE